MERKQKILSGLIFILAGQFIALCDWYMFKENSFLILFLASIVGFLVSYKGSKKMKTAIKRPDL